MINKIRLEFEDWYSQQRRDQMARWHPPASLSPQEQLEYPMGRYTKLSQKQSNWESWFAAWAAALGPEETNKKPAEITEETILISDAKSVHVGKNVRIQQISVPLTPCNSARNHVNAEIESESEAKEIGIKYIPEQDGEYWTIEQIFEYMIKNLRDEDLIEILKCEKETDMIVFHHSVGQWIRNTFKLWDLNNPYLDGMHADEMSTEILKAIWRTVMIRETLGL